MTKWQMGLTSVHHPYSLKNIMGRMPKEEPSEYSDRLTKAQEILNGFLKLPYEDQVILVEHRLGTTVQEFKSHYEIYG